VTFGRVPRIKTSAQIIAELEALRQSAGVRAAFIVDDNLIGNKKIIKEVLRDVIAWQKSHDYPLTFITEASLDLVEDDELITLMDEANIRSVFVGIETPNEESLKEKVEAIQAHGIEVWSGMILGFDNDSPDIFERQIRLVEEAGIVHASVGMLSAIPKTPLYDRVAREHRLDSADRTEYGTNIIPLGMDRATLRDGYLRVLRELYDADRFFSRVDTLYLDGRLKPSLRDAELSARPLRRLMLSLQALVIAAAAFVRLQTAINDRALKRTYRRIAWNLLRRRPSPFVVQAYAIKFVMHYHYHRLVSGMSRDGHLVNMF
jgi:radical SAM superfamily enzyme YgiQ (UPF0313 family)